MNAIAIFTLICLLVPPAAHETRDEPAEAAEARYQTIAQAIEDVAGSDERLQLFMLAVARHESHYRLDIHEGKVRGDGGRSWGLFQLRASQPDVPSMKIKGTPYRFGDIVGTSPAATRRAVTVAAGILAPIIERCHGDAYCTFKSYGGIKGQPRPKTEARLQERVATYGRLRSVLAQTKKKRTAKERPAAVVSFASALPTLVMQPHLGM